MSLHWFFHELLWDVFDLGYSLPNPYFPDALKSNKRPGDICSHGETEKTWTKYTKYHEYFDKQNWKVNKASGILQGRSLGRV